MLWTAFILGLAGSMHCVGMCGPIVFVLPVDRKSKPKMIWQLFLYQFGRVLSYTIIGVFFGFIGKGLYLAGFQQRISVLMGVLMIVIVLIPVRILNNYNFSKPIYGGIQMVKKKMGFYLQKKSSKALFSLGVFNGFLPCGLVYMALLGAIGSGTVILGGIYMLLFGLGTIPLMVAVFFAGNFVSLTIRKKIQRAIPVFVVIIGLLFILRGLGLGIPYISPSDANLQISNTAKDCVTVD
ncbi:MAG: hypothetical protein COB98_00150 [Flavobacteriaceae bacterium]|nr:MAG: hypothetical protein COB98_00150 [Flavobacteriaceae bacterium]